MNNSFVMMKKTGIPGEKHLGLEHRTNKLKPHVTLTPATGTHVAKMNVLSNALTHLPNLLFIYFTLQLWTQISHSRLGPLHPMMFFSLRMNLVPHGRWLAEL